jgi:serine/threonine-protein kinase
LIRVGTKIAGRFVVDGILGDGASGETFSAWDLELERQVAVKMQVSRTFESATEYSYSAAYIGGEFQVGHSLSGLRGIPKFYESGTHAGRRYVVMELVDGVTLESLMRQSRPVGRETIAAVIGQLCDILEPVHQRRIVHRDIKLENVMVGPEGAVWLLDFGIAVPADEEIEYPAGTAGYAPPEQYEARPLTTRADIYGLGALLFTMSVMLPPYAESGGRPDRRVEPFDPERLTTIDPCLRSVGLSMISWDPADRPATVREVLEALRPLLPTAGSRRDPKAPMPDPTQWYRDRAPAS